MRPSRQSILAARRPHTVILQFRTRMHSTAELDLGNDEIAVFVYQTRTPFSIAFHIPF